MAELETKMYASHEHNVLWEAILVASREDNLYFHNDRVQDDSVKMDNFLCKNPLVYVVGEIITELNKLGYVIQPKESKDEK